MFGLSWDQIILILLAALFLLGPERIPVAVRWLMDSLRKMRSMAAGAQEQMRSQLGPEIDELRRQVAELQSLKEVGELRALRDLDPRRMVGKSLLGDQFSGGMSGFLGLGSDPQAAATNGTGGTPAGGNQPAATPAANPTPAAAPTSAANATPATTSTSAAPASGTAQPDPGARLATGMWIDDDST